MGGNTMTKKRDPEAVAIGARVRLARQTKGMTIEALAEAAETSYQFLSQVERGEQTMTAVKFGRLAKALGVSADYLIFGKPPLEEPAALAVEYLSQLTPIRRELLSQALLDLQGLLGALEPEHG